MKKWSSKQNTSTTALALYKLKKSAFFLFRVVYVHTQNWVLLFECIVHAHLCCHILSHTWENPLQTIEYINKCRISSCACVRAFMWVYIWANVWCVNPNVTWALHTFSINKWSHPCEVWLLVVLFRFRRSKKKMKNSQKFYSISSFL